MNFTSTIILLLTLLCFGILFSRGKWYCPQIVVPAVWLISLLAYYWIDKGANPLTAKTFNAIAVWVTLFCITSWSVQSYYLTPLFKDITPSKVARDIYFYFTLATIPILLLQVILIVRSGSNPFIALREANVSGTTAGIRTTSFFVLVWLTSYIMELRIINKNNIWRIVVLALANLFYAVASMGKMNILILVAATVIILSERKLIGIKHLAVCLFVLIFLFVGIQKARKAFDTSGGFAALYLTTSLSAFEHHVQPQSSEHPAENTFRLYYAIKAKLDGGRTKPVNPILKFKPVKVGKYKFGTNTYTCLYPYYKDFGMKGVVIFSIVIGFIFGCLFKRAEDGSVYALVMYAILYGTLFMQFIGDTFFTVLSQNIQYFVFAIIPFMISKYHLFEKHG